MCHTIYTFAKCLHIDISDDVKHFPPCICNTVRATVKLQRACNACVRYPTPTSRREHKKMVEMQVERFRRLGLPWAEVERLVPRWRRIIGLGKRLERDWAESDDEDDSGKILLDETKQVAILEAIEDESAVQIHSAAPNHLSRQDKPDAKMLNTSEDKPPAQDA
ncbi:hypothetical protein Dda_9250 [Drechslerella dactyloides]|uniref:Uncharacterized protein n=1 Tax=Drechslerella dactyloides TaxID=74499 RepID=A0AAD6IPI1_DREDA|nr:hypothetical protein Dda_9250 [Drechslerella dactyloides]